MTKEIIADPHHSVVLMHVKITGDEDVLPRLKCYALLAPHLDGGGADNSARSVQVAGRRVLLAWKGTTVSLAMGRTADSRELVRLCRDERWVSGSDDGHDDGVGSYGQALDGNIAVTGEIDVAKHREFTIAISLGDGHHAALSGMMQSLATSV